MNEGKDAEDPFNLFLKHIDFMCYSWYPIIRWGW